MVDEIIDAVQKEAEAFSKENGEFIGQIILKTNFINTGEVAYVMPLGLLDILGGSETSQYPGGVTRVDWNWAFNLYNYYANVYGDDVSGETARLMKWTDQVRRHFSTRNWLTQGMKDIECRYDFRFTLSGVQEADHLKYREGLCKGWRFMFESIALDKETDSVCYDPEAKLKEVIPLPLDNS